MQRYPRQVNYLFVIIDIHAPSAVVLPQDSRLMFPTNPAWTDRKDRNIL